MEIAKIIVKETTGFCCMRKRIPAGLVGGTVSVTFEDPQWVAISKTVIFRGAETRIAQFDGSNAIIPAETVSQPGSALFFGIWGYDAETGLQLPLIEVRIGIVETATDPEADPGTDPSLPVWADLQNRVEDLESRPAGSGIDVSGAVPGQTVKIAAVDDKGRPTAWDPADFPESGGNVDQEQITASVNEALAEAKASGEFDGKDGVDGKDGQPGKDGVDGKDGYTPVKGVDYFDGKDGQDGSPGTPGADGITPHVGSNGNWFIGEDDTGIPATGPAGGQGLPGTPGEDGQDGSPGKDGVTPHIGSNGNWYIGDTDTGKPSRGADGKDGVDGKDGNDGQPGKDGADGAPGEKGDKGDKGDPGEPGKDGTNGKDGTSATHNWNGTVLTITSASGTSSADLKGDKGDKGDTGAAGKDGVNGNTSVKVVTKVEYSALTADAVAQLYADGIRLIVVEDGYTNLVPKSTDVNGNVYRGCGYLNGYRLTSSGGLSEQGNTCVSGFMPYTHGSTIRIVGSCGDVLTTGGQYVGVYDANYNLVKMDYASSIVATWNPRADGLYELTIDTSKMTAWSDAKYFRVSCVMCVGADMVVTVNEPIGLEV